MSVSKHENDSFLTLIRILKEPFLGSETLIKQYSVKYDHILEKWDSAMPKQPLTLRINYDNYLMCMRSCHYSL